MKKEVTLQAFVGHPVSHADPLCGVCGGPSEDTGASMEQPQQMGLRQEAHVVASS